jgi:chromosome segregation ATPase
MSAPDENLPATGATVKALQAEVERLTGLVATLRHGLTEQERDTDFQLQARLAAEEGRSATKDALFVALTEQVRISDERDAAEAERDDLRARLAEVRAALDLMERRADMTPSERVSPMVRKIGATISMTLYEVIEDLRAVLDGAR